MRIKEPNSSPLTNRSLTTETNAGNGQQRMVLCGNKTKMNKHVIRLSIQETNGQMGRQDELEALTEIQSEGTTNITVAPKVFTKTMCFEAN